MSTSITSKSEITNNIIQIFCCIGTKGAQMAVQKAKGVNCCDAELKYALRVEKILEGWYAEGDVICEGRVAEYVVSTRVGAEGNIPFPAAYTITVPDGYGGSITLYDDVAANIAAIYTYINANTETTGFSAGAIPGAFIIYAPYGYNGIQPSGTFITTVQGLDRDLTSWGFQNSCEEVIAGEPCLTATQIEKLIQDLNRMCGICCAD